MSAAKPKHQAPSKATRNKRFWEFTVPAPAAIVISVVVMAALAAVVNVFNAPNPNMILISGLVICAALLGYAGGVPAAIVMMAYTLYFFSTNNDFITFTDTNLQKVIVTAVGVVVTTFFVSQLRLTVLKSFKELREMTDMLEEDNRLLEEASSVDTLTKVSNRLALRRDFPAYLDEHLHVMMMDIDDFKQVNDRYGHGAGDHVLNQMGKLLAGLYTPDHVYRYGGDEFLVISPNTSVSDFQKMAAETRRVLASIRVEGADEPVHFSAGYVYGTPEIQSDLRLMIRQADLNLYASKNAGKNQISGCAFSRSIAEKAVPRDNRPRTREDLWR